MFKYYCIGTYCRLAVGMSLYLFACANYAQTSTSDSIRHADPTRPLGYEQASGEGISVAGQPLINLSSILWGSERKIAIINGQPLHENQIIKGVGAKVKKIESDAVTLQQGNKVWRVLLNKTVIRK